MWSYRWWKKSCTTQHVWNPVNTGIFTISTGTGFLPSTVCIHTVITYIYMHIKYKCFSTEMTDCAHFYESKDPFILQSRIFCLQYQPWTKQTSQQFLQFLLYRSQNDLLIYLARCPNATMLKCCWNRNAAITEIQQRMVEREIRKSFLSLKRGSVKAS